MKNKLLYSNSIDDLVLGVINMYIQHELRDYYRFKVGKRVGESLEKFYHATFFFKDLSIYINFRTGEGNVRRKCENRYCHIKVNNHYELLDI